MYAQREYRNQFNPRLEQKRVAVAQTDLAVLLPPAVWAKHKELEAQLTGYISTLRDELEDYISLEPDFFSSHQPLLLLNGAPRIALAMACAANICGVGPMAAVAGAFAQAAGHFLQDYAQEGMIENGGDIFIWGKPQRLIGVFAGKSPFSGKIALRLPGGRDMGVCTSSGTVGPSFSYGCADAAVLIADDALLADAAATACGNIVQGPADVKKAADLAAQIPGIKGALVIKDDQLAAWGALEIVNM